MKIGKIKETCLYVQDLKASEQFYGSILGFPVIGLNPNRHIFFRVGPSVLLCFVPEKTKVDQELPPHYAYGPQHLAFEIPKVAYHDWKRKIKKAGIKIVHEQLWSNQIKSFYFHDPEGNLLEIVPEGMWDSTQAKIPPD